jgi:predicted ABC-type transport system involved in lysophospholipase L1 biosynthesis ATPase subunit
MTENNVLLELDHVAKSYPMPAGDPVEVLRDVTLSVARGESLAIVGPSGSGKSTLLNIAGTLDRPTRGLVRLIGRDLADLDDRALAALRNRKIGFVFQLHHLLPQCTVLENVLLPTLASGGRADAQAEKKARELLERVGLGGRADHLPGQLSGGESQRAAVVRALINDPPLLLADEPTGSLDRASAAQLGDLLVELNRTGGLALIVVTHSQELAGRMGRQRRLIDGRLQAGDNGA